MQVFVYGWYGHGNIGDESYKLSFPAIWPDHQFIFSDNPAFNNNLHTYKDLCIIGGGDVVRPESLKATDHFTCRRIAVSVTITAQSLCPEIHKLDHIYVRDRRSANVLHSYGYHKYTYLPDISIILKGDPINGTRALRGFGLNSIKGVCSVIVNAHLMGTYDKKYYDKITFDKFTADLANVIDKTDMQYIFLPFATQFPWDDRVANGIVQSNVKKFAKNAVIYNPLSVQEAIDIITVSDMVISTRFHGLIFGLGNDVPTVTFSFHDKFAGFCNTVKQPFIDYYNSSEQAIRQAVEYAEINNQIDDTKTIKSQYIEKVHFMRGK